MLWSTVSKAFLRSMKTPHEKRPWFILICIAFTMSNIACWVEWPLRKPYWEEYNTNFYFRLKKLVRLGFSRFYLKIRTLELWKNTEFSTAIFVCNLKIFHHPFARGWISLVGTTKRTNQITTTTSLFLTLNIQISHHLQIARLIEAGGV